MRPSYYRVEVRARVPGLPRLDRAEVECFDLVDALGLGFYEGNALKYMFRLGRKTADRGADLRKAATYLAQAVERLGDAP